MAQGKFRNIMSGTTGLNNFVDPKRLEFDFKTGLTELSQAVNVNVDNSGRPSRRLGWTEKLTTAAEYSFVSGEVCLFVSGQTLYQMKNDYSLTAIRSDLTLGQRMKYLAVAGRIYYANGVEKGYVYKGTDRAWEKGNYTVTGDTPRIFSDPPNGQLIGWFATRALVAVDNWMCASEPSFYGVFDLHNNSRPVPDRVTMLQPTPQGLWIGTNSQVMFYRGSKWRELRREPKADYGVIDGSDVVCQGEKLGASGRPIMFTTPQGICIGREDGTLENISYNKLTFPAGRYASAAIAGDRYIVLIEG
jgi:hypothetical protein